MAVQFADTLFHFTASLDSLRGILKMGFWPRYCPEDIQWTGYTTAALGEFIAYPMVCFCDIPLTRIFDHTGFYGGYGIGMSKDWGKRNGLNPVLYVAEGIVKDSLKSMMALTGSDAGKRDLLLPLIANTKPIRGRMVKRATDAHREFYEESEWRYIPPHRETARYMRMDNYNDPDELEKANGETRKNCLLTFQPSDVRYIFAPNEDDLPDLVRVIADEMEAANDDDRNILFTRVTSLERIGRDT